MLFFQKKAPLLPTAEQERVVARIREAESRTTGELRVYIESECGYVDAMDRAMELFTKLGMSQTERRNAVIVYLALEDHQYAIYGDTEIFTKAGGPRFWEQAGIALRSYLKTGNVAEGLCACIDKLGDALASHFPYDPAVPKNELPDEIVFGK